MTHWHIEIITFGTCLVISAHTQEPRRLRSKWLRSTRQTKRPLHELLVCREKGKMQSKHVNVGMNVTKD